MNPRIRIKSRFTWIASLASLSLCGLLNAQRPAPVPDKLVVLTFDDSVKSHHSIVRPLLKEMGFGATFFITEGFSFSTNKKDYMTWQEIAELHSDGFEIGNHTVSHLSATAETLGRFRLELDGIKNRCLEHGIPAPTSFAWPGNSLHPGALKILSEAGITLARRGGSPEHPYEWGNGVAFEPGHDHPLLIPSAGDARPDWTLTDFKRAADQAQNGRIAVLQFHGVPDRDHPWVHTDPKMFRTFLSYLKTNQFKVVALRDLAPHLEGRATPADPFRIVEARKKARSEQILQGLVKDSATGKAIASRVYIRNRNTRTWHFPKSGSLSGFAVKYDRQSGFSTNSHEKHTSLSAHPWRVELIPGEYEIRVECGKEYFPETRTVTVGNSPANVEIMLRRWIDMASEGWYSGDAHNHRAAAEIGPNLLSENLNIALPMVDWTTSSEISPADSPQSDASLHESKPNYVSPIHAWYPRNTEYEIFRIGSRPHTLGAVLILNHRTRFNQKVFPLKAIGEQARAEGALLDLEKHNWNWSLLLPPILGIDLFELANNHHWQTEFGVRNWAIPGAPWMKLPDAGTGIDTELGWTHYGFQTYYALLNCGFKIKPTAGTANGVHPVPLGFSRVYVHVEQPFTYERWIASLGAGRSFVSTGPMLTMTADATLPGNTLKGTSGNALNARIRGRVRSEQPIQAIEVVVNGEVVHSIDAANARSSAGSCDNPVDVTLNLRRSGWIAVRCFERRENGRVRFAHTAPWWVDIPGAPSRPKRVQVEWILETAQQEFNRSSPFLPEEGRQEYTAAIHHYRKLLETAEPEQ